MDEELKSLWATDLNPGQQLEVLAAMAKLDQDPVPPSLSASLKRIPAQSSQHWNFRFDYRWFVPVAASALALLLLLNSPIMNNQMVFTTAQYSLEEEDFLSNLDSEATVLSLNMEMFDQDFIEELL